MEELPNYYAIIPAHVRYDEDLKPMEVILYGEITALSNKYGYAYATNSYFANLYKVHKNTVSLWINHLKEKGYISTSIIKNEKNEIQQRKIYITALYQQEPINENVDTPNNKNVDTPINKNVEENNTRFNNTRGNNRYTGLGSAETKNQKKIPYQEVIEYLNDKAGKNFSYKAKRTREQIKARFNEGHTLEDFKHVIDVKVLDWLDDTAMRTYLKPETLFNSRNFDNYKNETEEEVKARREHWNKKQQTKQSSSNDWLMKEIGGL